MGSLTVVDDGHGTPHVNVDGQDVLVAQPPEVVAFLADLVGVCQAHGLMIDFDEQGGHSVGMYSVAGAMRLLTAAREH